MTSNQAGGWRWNQARVSFSNQPKQATVKISIKIWNKIAMATKSDSTINPNKPDRKSSGLNFCIKGLTKRHTPAVTRNQPDSKDTSRSDASGEKNIPGSYPSSPKDSAWLLSSLLCPHIEMFMLQRQALVATQQHQRAHGRLSPSAVPTFHWALKAAAWMLLERAAVTTPAWLTSPRVAPIWCQRYKMQSKVKTSH